ncbi:HEAT repeat domain-containing protein [Streptomyces sp. NPDC001478]
MTDAWTAARSLAGGVPPRTALGASPAGLWPALDHAVRELPLHELGAYAAPGGRGVRWDPLAPLAQGRDAHGRSAASESEAVIALCHHDGRIREAALERVADFPFLLPLLIVRCADWAPPVRDRARALLARVPAPPLVAQAELILLLDRREQGGFAAELLDRTLREAPAATVLGLLGSEDRATRRFAHRVALDRALLPPGRLARLAARSGDAALQVRCAEAAIASMREEEYDDVLGVLLAARSSRVRATGVTALRRAGRFDAARARLGDRARTVRECARYVVRRGGEDPLPLYRALCSDGIIEPGAAAGLGECGDPADADTLRRLVRHPLPAVRAQAVAGLRALDAASPEELIPLLDDPSPAVVRAATNALLPRAAGIPRSWLEERTAPDRPRATRVAALRLLSRGAGGTRPTG